MIKVIQNGNKVLFQGDSITNAFRKPEELCNAYQLGAGYALMASAQILARRIADNLTFVNRGVSGEGIRGLANRWQPDCLDLRPDVLSILVGINDAGVQAASGLTVDDYEANYRSLLARTREVLPEVRLVLCEPFVLPCGTGFPRSAENVSVYGDAVNRLADDFDAAVVPLQSVFAEAQKKAPPEYWSFDGIHPTAQGHWLIAQAWMKTTGES